MDGGAALGSAVGLIALEFDPRGVDQAQQALGNLERQGANVGANLTKVGLGLGALGVGLGKPLLDATKLAADFSEQISGIASVGGKEAMARLDEIRELALQLGADTAFSASEAANGIEEMVKAGMPLEDILGGAAAAALDLAAATGTGVSESAELMATLLNVYGETMAGFADEGEKATHIANLLAQAANASATDVHGLGLAFQQSAAVARGYGLTVDQTATALAILAQNGMKSSDMGTSLKTMLMSVTRQTKPAAAALRDLGLTFDDLQDASGQFIGIEPMFELFRQGAAEAGLSAYDLNVIFTQLFGSDAARAAQIFFRTTDEGWDGMRDGMANAGDVATQAETRLDNLQGDLEKLSGSFETLRLNLARGTELGLRPLVQMADRAVDAVAQMNPELLSTIGIVGAVTATTLTATGAFVVAAVKVHEVATAFRALGVGARLASLALGPVGIAVAAIGAAVVAYRTNFLGFADAVDGAVAAAGRFADVFGRKFAQAAERGEFPATAAVRALGKALYQATGVDFRDFFGDVADDLQDWQKRLGRAAAFFKNIYAFWRRSGENPMVAGLHATGVALETITGLPVARWFVDAADALRGFGDGLGRARDNFRELLDSGVHPLRAAFGALGMEFPALSGLFRTLGALGENAADTLGNVGGALRDAFAALLRGDLDTAVTKVFDAIGSALSGLLSNARIVGNGLRAALGAIDWAAVGAAAETALRAALDVLGRFGGWALARVREAVGSVDWGRVWDDARSLLGVFDLGAVAVRVSDWLTDRIPDVWGWLRDTALPALGEKALDLGRVAVNVLDWAKGKWPAIKQWLADRARELLAGGPTWDDHGNPTGIDLGQVLLHISGWVLDAALNVWQWLERVITGRGANDPHLKMLGGVFGGQPSPGGIDLGEVALSVAGWVAGRIADVWAWLQETALPAMGAALVTVAEVTVDVLAWAAGKIPDLIGWLKQTLGFGGGRDFVYGDDAPAIDVPEVIANVLEWGQGTLADLGAAVQGFLADAEATEVTFDKYTLNVKPPGDPEGISVDFSGIVQAVRDAWEVSPEFVANAERLGRDVGAKLGELIVGGVKWALANVGRLFEPGGGAGGGIVPGTAFLPRNAEALISPFTFGDAFAAFDRGFTEEVQKALEPEFEQIKANLGPWINEKMGEVWDFFWRQILNYDPESGAMVNRQSPESPTVEGEGLNLQKWFYDTFLAGGLLPGLQITGGAEDLPPEASAEVVAAGQAMGEQLAAAFQSPEFTAALEQGIANAPATTMQPVGAALTTRLREAVEVALRAPSFADETAPRGGGNAAAGIAADVADNLATAVAAVPEATFAPVGAALTTKLREALTSALSTPASGPAFTFGGGTVGQQLANGLLNETADAVDGLDLGPVGASFVEKLAAALGAATETIATAVKAVIDVTVLAADQQAAGEPAKAPGTTLVGTVSAAVTAAQTTLNTALQTVVAAGIDAGLLVAERGAEIGARLLATAGAGATGAQAALSSALETAVGVAVAAGLEAAKAANAVGAAIAQGAKAGIDDSAKAVADAAALMVRDAVDAAKKEGEIESPSRVMREVGQFFGEGFAFGLHDTYKLAEDAGGRLADAAAKGAASAGGPTVRAFGDLRGTLLRMLDQEGEFWDALGAAKQGQIADAAMEYIRTGSREAYGLIRQLGDGVQAGVGADLQAISNLARAVVEGDTEWFAYNIQKLYDRYGAVFAEPLDTMANEFSAFVNTQIDNSETLGDGFLSMGSALSTALGEASQGMAGFAATAEATIALWDRVRDGIGGAFGPEDVAAKRLEKMAERNRRTGEAWRRIAEMFRDPKYGSASWLGDVFNASAFGGLGSDARPRAVERARERAAERERSLAERQVVLAGDLRATVVIDERELGEYVIGRTIAPLSEAAERVGRRRDRL